MENLINRLKILADNERMSGHVNLELERQMEEIRRLYLELEQLRKQKGKEEA